MQVKSEISEGVTFEQRSGEEVGEGEMRESWTIPGRQKGPETRRRVAFLKK